MRLSSLFFPFLAIFCVHSSVNPIIYAYSSREFRRAFIKYLCRCFPSRLRNFLMSYHNLHLLHYQRRRRRRPSSIVSGDNLELNSDALPKHLIIPSLSSTPPTTIVINIQKTSSKSPSPSPSSKLCFRRPSRHLSNAFDETQSKNNLLVDYCTYHDVAVSRVTCL